jgi:hypothetical protein
VDSPDASMTVAIASSFMGLNNGKWPPANCGRKITLTNTGPTTDNSIGGKGITITVTVEDTCVGCDEGHLDLSVEAWEKLTNNAKWSTVGITWYVNTLLETPIELKIGIKE